MKNLSDYLENFISIGGKKTDVIMDDNGIKRYTNEFWTSKQRQASSIHEISYRACFKAQLPRFFIDLFTKEGAY